MSSRLSRGKRASARETRSKREERKTPARRKRAGGANWQARRRAVWKPPGSQANPRRPETHIRKTSVTTRRWQPVGKSQRDGATAGQRRRPPRSHGGGRDPPTAGRVRRLGSSGRRKRPWCEPTPDAGEPSGRWSEKLALRRGVARPESRNGIRASGADAVARAERKLEESPGDPKSTQPPRGCENHRSQCGERWKRSSPERKPAALPERPRKVRQLGPRNHTPGTRAPAVVCRRARQPGMAKLSGGAGVGWEVVLTRPTPISHLGTPARRSAPADRESTALPSAASGPGRSSAGAERHSKSPEGQRPARWLCAREKRPR